MTVTVRFAPAPTGYLHLGNARPALYNWLLALRDGGRFILRLDDTDRDRSTEAFATAIVEDLTWLGIRPEETHRQSDRLDRYRAAADALVAKGLLYPCYETAEELEAARRRRRVRRLPPIYDRAALALSAADRARLEAEGRRPHWRFLLPNFTDDPARPVRSEVHWTDLCRGHETVDLASLSDPVLIREDGTFLYTLPSVVDDAEMGVTHVVRGEDHITNTGVHIALFQALKAAEPAFGHLNLLADATGEGFSKRTGALSLRSLRAEGYEPEAVAAIAVGLGTSRAIEPVAAVSDLAAGIDLAAVSRSAAKFDKADLDHLNARIVHAMPFERAAPRLEALGLPPDPSFWSAVSANCVRIADAAPWWRIVAGPFEPPAAAPADVPLLDAAARLLPPEPWTGETFKSWTGAVKAETGRGGRALFLPIRLALTGVDHGPDLGHLLPLIGRAASDRRLRAASAGTAA